MAHKQMTLLSMEAIFQNMEIEQIWDIRKGNMALRSVIDDIPPKKLEKQFPIETVDVEGQIIAIKENGNRVNRNPIDGVSQTRWVAPTVLSMNDSNSRTMKKSFLPVATAFCKRMIALEVIGSQEEDSVEYFDSILRFLTFCPLIQAVGIHIKNLTEEQISTIFDNLTMNRELDEAKEFTLSVLASSQVTPAIVEKFLHAAGTRRRQLLIAEEDSAELKITNEAIKKMFITVNGDGTPWGLEQKIIVERMERQRAHDLIDELKIEFPTGIVEDQTRGYIAFWLMHDMWRKGFVVSARY